MSGALAVAAAGADKNADKKKTDFAFFDVDCRHPDPLNSEFVAAKTTEPIGDVLKKIYSKAQQLDAPVLALTCLSVQRHNPGMSVKDTVAEQNRAKGKQMAFISLNASAKEIEKAVSCHQIFLERRAYKSGQENVQEFCNGCL